MGSQFGNTRPLNVLYFPQQRARRGSTFWFMPSLEGLSWRWYSCVEPWEICCTIANNNWSFILGKMLIHLSLASVKIGGWGVTVKRFPAGTETNLFLSSSIWMDISYSLLCLNFNLLLLQRKEKKYIISMSLL